MDLKTLLSNAKTNPPCSEAELKTFEARHNLVIPTELRELFAITNGCSFERSEFEIMSLNEIDEFYPSFVEVEIGKDWNWFPFSIDNGDPYSISMRTPLSGYVLFVWHDSPPSLLSRNLKSFLQGINHSKSEHLYSLQTELDSEGPIPEDDVIANQLLEFAETMNETDRRDALAIALNFCSENSLDKIIQSKSNPELVAQAGAQKNSLQNIVKKNALKARRVDFAKRCAGELQKAGIPATWTGKEGLHIENGRIELNIDHFMDIAEYKNFSEVLLDRVQRTIRANSK